MERPSTNFTTTDARSIGFPESDVTLTWILVVSPPKTIETHRASTANTLNIMLPLSYEPEVSFGRAAHHLLGVSEDMAAECSVNPVVWKRIERIHNPPYGLGSERNHVRIAPEKRDPFAVRSHLRL